MVHMRLDSRTTRGSVFLLSAVGVLVEMVEGCILVSTAALWGSFEVNSTLFFFFLSAVCWRVGRLSVETGSCSVPDLLLLDTPKGDWRRVFVLGVLPWPWGL